jgi:hypothetical protein
MTRSACGAMLLLLLTACRHQPEPPSPWVRAGQPQPPLLVVETPLHDLAALEQAIDSLSRMGAADDAVALLLQVGRQLPDARLRDDAAARRWVMLAVYRGVQGSGLAERFDSVRSLVDALQAAAADAPETRFCRAYLRWILLQDDGKTLQAGALDRAIVVDLARDLAALHSDGEAFQGPQGWDAARIAREHRRVETLLASWSAAAPAAAPLGSASTATQLPSAATEATP